MTTGGGGGRGRGEQLLGFHPDPPMTKLCGYEKYDEKPIHEDEGKIDKYLLCKLISYFTYFCGLCYCLSFLEDASEIAFLKQTKLYPDSGQE